MANNTPNPNERLYVVYSKEFQNYISADGSREICYCSEHNIAWATPSTLVFSNKWKNIFGRKINHIMRCLSYEVIIWCRDELQNRLNTNVNGLNKIKSFIHKTGIYNLFLDKYKPNNTGIYLNNDDLDITAKILYNDLVFYELEVNPNKVSQSVVDLKTICGRKLNKLLS